MKIIIAGGGEVGISLARYLRAENNEIIMIDREGEKLKGVAEQLDIQLIEGSSALPSTLERAGAEHADVFLAVTGNDETNIVSCGLAKTIFNIPQRIARIASSEYMSGKYKSFLQSLAIDGVLSPEVETANRIVERLPIAGALDVVSMGGGLVRFVGLKCKKTSPLAGKTVADIRSMTADLSLMVVAVKRRFQTIPLSEVTIKSGDEVYFIVDAAHLTQALDIFGYQVSSPRYIVIYGGGRIGFQLAKLLEEDSTSHDITVIERHEERARFLAEKLSSALVINGDALDDTLVDELNLKNYQMGIAMTETDESNILLSLMSKRSGIERTCALLHNPLYDNLLSGLGIDATVNPNAIIVSSILQYLRKGRVKNDYFIQSGIGEILEMEALATSKITKMALGKISVPKGVLIAGVLRGDLFMLPNKDLIVQEKDIVFIFADRGHASEVEGLFSVGFSFF